MPAEKVLKRFFWVAFGAFLLASIPHVAYFFRAFEPQDGVDVWYWIVAYAIAISVDMTTFLLSLTVSRLRKRGAPGGLVFSVWAFLIGLAALSWLINWEYATQFASAMLARPEHQVMVSGVSVVGLINPIVASCFQSLAIAYTWISDKIADGAREPAQVAVSIEPVETADKTAQEIPLQLPETSQSTSEQPPPEPKRRKPMWRIVGFIVLLLCIVSVAIFAEWAGTEPKAERQIAPTPLATPLFTPTQATPTIAPSYTADEIYRDMEKDGCSCGAGLKHGMTLQDYAGDAVSVNATSSLTWSDPPTQQFYNMGLWVYASPDDALSAFTEVGVGNDASGRSDQETFTEHFHGRCLLLISSLTTGSPWSGYKQAIDKYCT